MKYLLIILFSFLFLKNIILAQDKAFDVSTPFPQMISEEEEKEQLKKLNDKLRKQLEEIKKYDKFKYQQLLHQAYFNQGFNFPYGLGEDKLSRERSKRINEIEIETELLGIKYQNEKNADKQKLKEELRTRLYELFDLREKERQEEFENLAKRLNELKESLTERKNNKDEIVKRRLRELVGEAKYLEW